jgi:epidermal growth factor receptor substrate 15
VFGSIAEEPKKGGEADPFAVDQDKAKEDFESAFASFKQARGAGSTAAGSGSGSGAAAADTAKTFATFNTEFPPISELERDDESETESEGCGFDDDFTPASPPPKTGDKAVASRSESPTVAKSVPAEAGAGAGAAARY